MKHFLDHFNHRTILALLIAAASVWIVQYFDIRIHNHLMLYSLIIAFPLVFSLQSAFKRRDRALEYVSNFKGALLTIWQCILLSKNLGTEGKNDGRNVIARANEALLDHLRTGQPVMQDVYHILDDIMKFLKNYRSEISGRIRLRITRYMKDVYESATYLDSQRTHRTLKGLRVLSSISINVFPLFQAGVLQNVLTGKYALWIIYPISLITALILITLYNIQHNIEYPFDQRGADELNLGQFKVELNE